MENFETTLNLFLAELKKSSALSPEIIIDYQREKIRVISAPSSFLKQLSNLDKILLHLGKDGVTVQFFK